MAAPPESGGRILGHYRLLEQIGAGGMGVVYRAHDELLERDVALKELPAGMLADENARKRFRNEALSLAKLNHPNIATIYEFGSQDETDFLVTEYIPGISLEEKLVGAPLPAGQVLDLGAQLARGLSAAHEQGIVHRDLKPANLRVTPDGRLKILDFGLARLMPRTDDLDLTVTVTEATGIAGTLPYMAPEQLRGQATDVRSDIWAVGAVLYEMATGERPFPQTNAPLLIDTILHQAPVPPSKVSHRVSPGMDNLVLKALSKDPRHRYQTVRDLGIDLERLTAGVSPLGKRRRDLKRALFASGMAVAVGVFAMLGFWTAHRPRQTSSMPIEPTANSGIKTRRSVAVLGFKNLSGRSDEAWLSTAIAEMLATELAAGDQLRTVPGENVAQMKINLALPDEDSYGQETLAKIRKNLNADDVVLGSYIPLGRGQIRLDLRLQDTIRGETLASISAKGREAQIDALVSRAGAALRERLGADVVTEQEAVAVKATLPSNPEAARFYSEGLARMRTYDNLEARGLLQKAVAAEPGFALAHSALAGAWANLGYDTKANEEAKMAFDLSSGLSRQERFWVEGRYREAAHEWDKGEDLYHSLWQTFPDNIEYGLRLASVQMAGGKNKDASTTLEGLRKLPPPAGDDPRIDLAEADVANYMTDFKRQLAVAERAAQKGRSQGARFIVAMALVAEGRAWRSLGEPDKSLTSLVEARKLYEGVGDRAGEARVLKNIGNVYYDKGDLTNARKLFEETVHICQELGNRKNEAGVLNNLAVVLAHQKDITGATKVYQQSLIISRDVGDLLNVGILLNNIAELQRQMGDFASAHKNYEEALSVDRKIGNQDEAAAVLSNLAIMLTSEGNLAGARAKLEQSLAINRASGNKRGLAIDLINLGDLRLAMGELADAEKLYRDALEIFQEMGAKVNTSWALYGLAEIQFDRDDLSGARQKHQEALSLREKGGEKGAAAESRMALAEISLEQGEMAETDLAAHRALDEFQKEGDSYGQARAKALLARSFLQQSKLSEARQAIDESKKLSGASSDRGLRIAIAIHDARVRAAEGRKADASKALHKSESETRKIGLVSLEYDARLALGELEVRSGDAVVGRARLAALQKDASDRGFRLIARKASSHTLQ